MTDLVMQMAAQIGWVIGTNTVVVEGTSDVEYLVHAAGLHDSAQGGTILDDDFRIVAAGAGEDGGVEGVNRRVNMMRQIADSSRAPDGSIVYRFFGLLDNDWAGRNALEIASKFDRRLVAYADIMLIHPVMPILTAGVDLKKQIMEANRYVAKLDWEIEDLCSARLLAAFEADNPRAIKSRRSAVGRIHHEFEPSAKAELKRYFLRKAQIEDVGEMLQLLKALRSYAGLEHRFIRTG